MSMSSSSSSSSSSWTRQEQEQPQTQSKKKVVRIESNTGGLRRLPVVKPANELLNRALQEARRVLPDSEMKHVRNRARKHGTETINQMTNSLCVPLRDVVNGYKAEWKRFHPFERVVADLTARARQKKSGHSLNSLLDNIHEARKMIREASKDWMAKIKSAATAKEAGEAMEEAIVALQKLFEQCASGPVTDLLELQRGLRSAPVVALDTPAVVLVGAPNVGKSSIVRCISSGTPEVNNYPFTTRGMTLGHVEVFWTDQHVAASAIIPRADDKKNKVSKQVLSGKYAYSQLCQVMDSPGLLSRPDEERNEMESLTMAAMQHLPTAVMFVLDLTGDAGDKCSSIADQLQLRREVRARFPRRPWIDVVSKVDLGIMDGSLDELQRILDQQQEQQGSPALPFIQLSVKDGRGIDELKNRVMRVLGEVRVVLDAMATVDKRHAPRPAVR